MSDMPTETRYPFTTIESYFRKPPLLGTEDIREYEAMFKLLSERVKPQDEFELFWVNDFLHECLQIRRWRRSAAALIEMMSKDALRTVLESVIQVDLPDRSRVIDGHVVNWFKDGGDKLAVLTALGQYGLDERHITAQAMSLRLPELDKIERMIGDFERRRSAALRELEDYRITASWRAPKGLPALIDAAADESKTAVATGGGSVTLGTRHDVD
jgi:hypothetical protein